MPHRQEININVFNRCKIGTLCDACAGVTRLGGGDLDVDDDGSEGGLAQLRRVVDGVCVQNHQLQRAGQFENPLNLTLDLSCKMLANTFLFLFLHCYTIKLD